MTAKTKRSAPRSSGRYKHKPRGISDRVFEKAHWPYLPILIVTLFLVAITASSGVLASAVRNPSAKVLAYSSSMSVGGLLSSTNGARASEGAAALQLNSKLNAAAQAKAEDMAARNYWSHNTPEGNPPWIFVTSQNYSYQKLGENLAAGFDSEQATINGWLASPPHKQNLMDSAFNEVGFGFANNPDYTSAGGGPMTIVVAFYGKPAASSAAPPASATTPAKKTPPPAPPVTQTPPPPPQAPAPQPEAAPSPAPIPQQPDLQPSQPVTTENSGSGITLAVRTTRAQVAFAKLPVSSFATGLATFAMVAAAGLWISRHALGLRYALAASERYVIKHPLVDVGLITIGTLSYLISQTAGFVQ